MQKVEYAKLPTTQLMQEVAKSPRKPVLNHHVSLRLFKEGKREKALVHALRAMEATKPNSAICSQAARCLIALRMPRAAEIIVRDAMSRGLQTHQLYFRLAQALARQKQAAHAMQSLDYAISLKPKSASYANYRTKLQKLAAKG